MPWLKLEALLCVVDECETGALSTTKLGPESEHNDLVLGGLVHCGELVSQLVLADVGAGRVQDIDHHLLALQEPVGDLGDASTLASPNSSSVVTLRTNLRVRTVTAPCASDMMLLVWKGEKACTS